MSTPEGTTPGAPPPPPATRTLSVVLADALAKGEEVRMLVAKGLADSASLIANPTAYMNVELEGQLVTIPKLAGSGLGGTATGYAVYVLVTKDFLIAVGTVAASGTGATGGGIIPVGGMIEWPTATPPAGWLICDGSAFSASTYPALAAVLGTTTLPDRRKRVSVGAGSGFAVGSNDGAAEGSRSISHHHSFSGSGSTGAAGGHSHGAAGNHWHQLESGGMFAQTGLGLTGAAGSARYVVSDGWYNTNASGDHTHPSVGDHTHSVSVGGNTSGGSPTDAPSYYAVNYIIRAT